MRRTKKPQYCLTYEGKAPEAGILAAPEAELFSGPRPWAAPKDWTNLLVHGENLGVLASLLRLKGSGRLCNADGTPGVRLVYIDPPFSTRLVFRSASRERAYDDLLTGPAFIEFVRQRLVLIREILSDNGSVFVHLDWKMAHIVKTVMDEVFGEERFLNDIVWHYGGRGAKAVSSKFSRNHDIILWYGCDGHVFNRRFTQRRIQKGSPGFRMDEAGRWFKTSPRGDYTDESIQRLEREDRVYRTKNGKVRVKYFLKEDGDCLVEEKLVGDVWDDIPDAMHISATEKTGYPTQKPESLLRRIIEAASNPGDVVLDAFCGAGTALVAAGSLKRRWIGIDSGQLAIKTALERLGSPGCKGAFTLLEAHVRGTGRAKKGARKSSSRAVASPSED